MKSNLTGIDALPSSAAQMRDWQIVYHAFDLLELEGEDWKARLLTERKQRLQQLLSGSERGSGHRSLGRVGAACTMCSPQGRDERERARQPSMETAGGMKWRRGSESAVYIADCEVIIHD